MTRTTPRTRDDYRHWHSLTTRWSDNDVYGHVNNAIYYHWFDTAVNSWLIDNGLLDVEHGNPIGLVAETRCRYLRSISYPAPVSIGIALARLGTSSVTFNLGAFGEQDIEPLAEGDFTHVYVDRGSRRPVAIPPHWREALRSLVPDESLI
jgi:acyl-CoA thioester hydrolase